MQMHIKEYHLAKYCISFEQNGNNHTVTKDMPFIQQEHKLSKSHWGAYFESLYNKF